MNIKSILLLVIILTTVLRIYDIETKNMWFDEVYSWKISQKTVIEIIEDTSGDIHPPLYYIVLKYWTNLFTDSVLSMRLLSVVLSLLSVIILYRILKIIFKKEELIIFALLLYAVSPVNIFYSQEIRMLNLNLFLCLGSVYYFMISSEENNFKNNALYVLFTFLAVYTHYFALLIFFTEFIILVSKVIFRQRSFTEVKKQFASILIINILYVPWYPFFFNQITKGQPWRTVQSFRDSGMNFLSYFKDLFLSVYFSFEPTFIQYLATFISYFILAYLLYVLFRFFNSKENILKNNNYIVLFFYLPLLIAAIISIRQSIVFSRYLSILVPFLIITLLFFSNKFFKRKFTIALFLFLFCVSCLGVYINFGNKFKNNDYRKVISYLEQNFREGEEIIVEPHFMGWSIDYYRMHSETRLPNPVVLGWDIKMQIDSLKNRNDFNEIWLIQDYSSLENHKYDSTLSKMKTLGFERSKEKTFFLVPSKVNISKYSRIKSEKNTINY